MREGNKILILKYGTSNMYDCIDRHKAVIKKNGYCWFGKIGKMPGESKVKEVLVQECPQIVLYSQGKAYLCDVESYQIDKPNEGYPDYYDSFLFGRAIIPSMYFKLLSIKELEIEELAKCVICKSGRNVLETLTRSMNSFFYAELPDENYTKPEPKEKRERKPKKVVKKEVASNDCIYRIDGICENKRCISYEYECSRPSMCAKQKTKK